MLHRTLYVPSGNNTITTTGANGDSQVKGGLLGGKGTAIAITAVIGAIFVCIVSIIFVKQVSDQLQTLARVPHILTLTNVCAVSTPKEESQRSKEVVRRRTRTTR
jgi:hypothetical protein